MHDRKFQIFVSSTYEDLKDERQVIIKSILEMGHIPVGMEMFNAADEDQWQVITRTIDDCDYYIIILAHRYGSQKNDISYTQMEYEYAKSKGIPTLGFVISESAKWQKNKMDTRSEDVEKLKKLKSTIQEKLVDFWQDSSELESKFIKAIHKAFTMYKRVGWIKASEGQSPKLAEELSRLSSENAHLREKIKKVNPLLNASDAALTKMIKILQQDELNLNIKFSGTSSWENVGTITLWEIFRQLSINIDSNRNSIEKLSKFFASVMLSAEQSKGRTPADFAPIGLNTLRGWCRHLEALGLLKNIMKNELPSDSWTTTEEGRALYSFHLRKKILGKAKL